MDIKNMIGKENIEIAEKNKIFKLIKNEGLGGLIKHFRNSFNSNIDDFKETSNLLITKAKEQGFSNIMKAVYSDLFDRSLSAWLYLITLAFIIPIGIEFWVNGTIKDPVSLFTSITGIICVILVAEGRASNYFFGLITNTMYLILSIKSAFYGEIATMVYFIIMQPIGLYTWLRPLVKDAKKENENHQVKARKFKKSDWLRYLILNIVVWQVMGYAYKSINSASPFRDSITDATNVSGQLAQTNMYREQWLFWILTNIFSMYLWFGNGFAANSKPANLSIMVMYLVYTINSVVGWINWSKEQKLDK